MNPFGENRQVQSKVKSLFDFQRFAGNSHLTSLIAETENRYSHELDDDDLDFVNAAGEIESLHKSSHFSKGDQRDD